MQKTPKLISQLQKFYDYCAQNKKPSNVVDLFLILLQEAKFKTIVEQHIPIDALEKSLQEKLPELFPEILDNAQEELDQVLTLGEEIAAKEELGYYDTEHLFLALLVHPGTIKSWFLVAEFPIDEIALKVFKLASVRESAYIEQPDQNKLLNPPEQEFPSIQKFCRNLNNFVMEKEPLIFGRDNEVSSILDILCRQKKANVLMIGEPGVGRKSIVHKTISYVLSGKCSDFLRDKTFLQLDITAITAGTAMFGSLEKRFQDLLEELRDFEDAVLVIPDFQIISSKGNDKGSGDVSMFIKTLLGNNIPCIATITQSDFKANIEDDKSLTSFFEIIRVSEPKRDEVQQILQYKMPELEGYHQVWYEPEAISVAIDLCEKFLPYRKFPDKAIDVLDSIGAKVKNRHFTQPEELQKQWEKITESFYPNIDKDSAAFKKINKSIENWAKKFKKWMDKADSEVPLISKNDVLKFFASQHKITDNQIKQLEESSIENLADNLKLRIFGQDEAIDKISDVLLCSKTGLRDKNKPLAKFLLSGETGCGKTQVAKDIADLYFGNPSSLIKLDMSEFSDKHSSASLLGSPAGYVGYKDGGRLTEFVKNNPSCVVLFDEFEKAHPELQNLLLQIMDEGCLTDGSGFKVDFTNTIVIITTNLGAGKQQHSVGFVPSNQSVSNQEAAIKAHFRPEFLARLDEVVFFNPITEGIMSKILNKFINESIQKLRDSNIELNVDGSFIDHLLAEIKKETSHARNIQATVRKNLDVPVSKFILKNRPKKIFVAIQEKVLEIS